MKTKRTEESQTESSPRRSVYWLKTILPLLSLPSFCSCRNSCREKSSRIKQIFPEAAVGSICDVLSESHPLFPNLQFLRCTTELRAKFWMNGIFYEESSVYQAPPHVTSWLIHLFTIVTLSQSFLMIIWFRIQRFFDQSNSNTLEEHDFLL